MTTKWRKPILTKLVVVIIMTWCCPFMQWRIGSHDLVSFATQPPFAAFHTKGPLRDALQLTPPERKPQCCQKPQPCSPACGASVTKLSLSSNGHQIFVCGSCGESLELPSRSQTWHVLVSQFWIQGLCLTQIRHQDPPGLSDISIDPCLLVRHWKSDSLGFS